MAHSRRGRRSGPGDGSPAPRIGVDVGGTNTDAVLMNGRAVVAWAKRPTTPDVTGGITAALAAVLADSGVAPTNVRAVMFGTTHFANAVVEGRGLTPAACVRLGLPATEGLPPMVDWPPALREGSGNRAYLAHGGVEYDGRPIAPLDEAEVRAIAQDIRARGFAAAAVSAVFSPVDPGPEERAAAILKEEVPGLRITCSRDIGRIGLLERENAALLNASLSDVAARIMGALRGALLRLGLECPFFFTQNDGTLMSAGYAERFPVLTFSSGPTNSMRGAAFLSGLPSACVVDLGGTTTDVGMLVDGFPREAAAAVEVGGVRTNFRMPDVVSIGLGGGSLVTWDDAADRAAWQPGREVRVGPRSVGYRLTEEARVFGGPALTATDLVVAAGAVRLGDPARVAGLPPDLVRAGVDRIHGTVEQAIDRMKTRGGAIPVILVGGGSVLIHRRLEGASEVVRPPHFAVANAIGAAIAQVGGEVDRVVSLADVPRARALEAARRDAAVQAAAAGADPATVTVVEVDEVPLAYLPGNATRVRVKAVGDLRI